MSFPEKSPVGQTIHAQEHVSVPEDIQRSQQKIAKLCEIISSMSTLQEELTKKEMTPSLFAKLHKLSNTPIIQEDWEIWRKIVKKLTPGLSAIAQKTPEGRLFMLREWRRLDEIEACDAEAVRLLSPEIFSKEERVDIRMRLGTLANGKVLRREVLGSGVSSTNAPSRYHLDNEDGTTMTAYAKSRLQEGAFKLDREEIVTPDGRKTNTWSVYQQVFDAKTNSFDWEKNEKFSDDESVKELFRWVASDGFQEAVRKQIAEDIGTDPEDVPYDTSEFNTRVGVLPGEMTVREWAVSRLDLLFGLKLVPLTVIRPDTNGDDIASVQEGVRSVDPRYPAREMTPLEAANMFDCPAEEWCDLFPTVGENPDEDMETDPLKKEPARSIARAGALAFLVGDLDGIEINCMVDPVTKKISKIDNGLGLGLLTGTSIQFQVPVRAGSLKMADVTHGDVVRSVPLELMLRHELTLDDETRAHLEGLYTKLRSPGRERDHVLNILSILFDTYGKKMTERQFDGLVERLKQLVQHGRPVGLVKGSDYMNELEMASVMKQASRLRRAA